MTERANPEHDVLVVGASIAGCRTALTLAERGVRVLLLDRARFPRWKPCAGGITLKTRAYIPEPLWDLVECTMKGAYFTYGTEYLTHLKSDQALGWTVHRESFDHAHLQLVGGHPNVDVAVGVTVRNIAEQAGSVRVETDSGEMEARVLVGADGAKSVVSRALPGHEDRFIGFAYEGEGRPTEPRLTDEAFFDFRKFPRGYGWIFPKEDHYSIGGFVYGRGLPEIQALYREFCEEVEFLRGVETYRARGHPIALGGNLRRLNSRRIVLTGEAADLVDPLTGEGIYYAFRSGHLAGEAIACFLEGGTPLSAYGDLVRREIQDDLRYGRVLADWVYEHPRISFHIFFRNALLCRWFTEVRSGAKSYKEVVREALIKGPLLPFHTGLSRHQTVQLDGVA
jgi:geranylgeranyl reductase family protein